MDNLTTQRPLLTFALLAYNQEGFIREAVEGALSQTYTPLEIILSDDSSPDATFETMRHMAAGYSGPHTVRLHRTPSNEGLCAHVNRVAGISKGALIIGAAGDDVSLPWRTELTYQAWENSGRAATSIWGKPILMNGPGQPELPMSAGAANKRFNHLRVQSSTFLKKRAPAVLGCSHAFAPALFSLFGPLCRKNVMEDFQLGFRSTLAGALTFIDAPLVKYRRHSNNISAGQIAGTSIDAQSFAAVEATRNRVLSQFEVLFEALAEDLQTAKARHLINEEKFLEVKTALDQEVLRTRLRKACLGTSMNKAAFLIWQFWRNGGGPRTTLSLVPRILPRPAYRLAVIFANRSRRFCGTFASRVLKSNSL